MNRQEKNQAFLDEINRIANASSDDLFSLLQAECNQVLAYIDTAKEAYNEIVGPDESDKKTLVSLRTFAHRKLIRALELIDENNEQLLSLVKAEADTDLNAQLITLNNLFPFDPETGCWQLPGYTLTDSDIEHDIWGLQVRIHPEEEFERALEISPPDDIETVDDYFHPHVNSSGYICWGDAKYPAQVFWKNKNYVALFQLLDALLKTYNNQSPYITLKRLAGQEELYCANCGYTIDYDNHYTHENGDPGCDDCLRWVEDREEYYWDSEVVWSNEYDEYLLSGDEAEVLCQYVQGHSTYHYMLRDDEDIYTCDCCETLVHVRLIVEDGLENTPFEYVCKRCIDKHLYKCPECGDILTEEGMCEHCEKENAA
jgi:hypothetical protein